MKDRHLLPATTGSTLRGNLDELILRSMMESPAGISVAAFDREYPYLYFTRAHRNHMLRARPAPIAQGECVLDVIPGEENRHRFKSDLDRALAGERFSHVREYGGSRRMFWEGTFNPIVEEGGAVIGVSLVSADVTERILADRVLGESEQRYRSFMQNFPGIVFRGTLQFKPLFFHGAVKEVTGYDEAEFVEGTLTWDQVVYPGDFEQFLKEGDKLFEKRGQRLTREYRIVRRNEEVRWVEETLELTLDEAGQELVQGVILDITERRRAEDALEETGAALRRLAQHLQDAREEERKHIADDVHHNLGQILTALRFEAAWLDENPGCGEREVKETAGRFLGLVDRTIGTVRQVVSGLRPRMLDELGLPDSAEWLAGRFREVTGLACELRCELAPDDITPETATTFFRVLQESLTNVARHSGASRVWISLAMSDEECVLSVEDDGRGISLEEAEKAESYGIFSMRERMAALGGTLTIQTRPGGGTALVARCRRSSE